VIHVHELGFNFEVATYRSDGAYSDKRRPDQVRFSTDLTEDVIRRDFTMNAIAATPLNECILDTTGGINDIENRLIRAVGDPDIRFREDALRMLRAIRFSAQLSFMIEAATWHAICRQAGLITAISRERVRDELIKMLMSPDPARAIFLLSQSGLMELLFPRQMNYRFGIMLRKLAWMRFQDAPYPAMLATLASEFLDSAEGDRQLDSYLTSLRLSEYDEVMVRNAVICCRQLRPGDSLRPATRAKKIRFLRKPGSHLALQLYSASVGVDHCEDPYRWEVFKTTIDALNVPEIICQPRLITGGDLIARGWEPGPAFKTIAAKIAAARNLNSSKTVLTVRVRKSFTRWFRPHRRQCL
jgi:tRNA nucleotidyltransferase/poly(A) polymerase